MSIGMPCETSQVRRIVGLENELWMYDSQEFSCLHY